MNRQDAKNAKRMLGESPQRLTPNAQHLRRRRCAYTLLEMLIALVMFAIITTATSFALTAVLRGQQTAQQRAEDLQEARTLLSIIGRDLRAAYASEDNPNTVFIADGNNSGTVLTFTALTHRIISAVGAAQSESATPVSGMPQSDVAVIRYSFDPVSGVFSRAESAIPNPDTLPEPNTPNTALSRRVRSIEFQFLDPNGGLRPDWRFTNAQAAAGGTAGGPSPGGDTTLPQSVRITLELASASGRAITYTTTVALATPEPQPKGQVPQEESPGTTGGGGTGGGGNDTGGNGGGNNGGNNSGGGGTGGGLPGLPNTPGPGGGT